MFHTSKLALSTSNAAPAAVCRTRHILCRQTGANNEIGVANDIPYSNSRDDA